MKFAWDRLPEPLLEGLCLGGAGKLHLLRLARACLGENFAHGANPALLRTLGLDLLCAAFEADPLDTGLAGQLAGLAPEAWPAPLGAAFAALGGIAAPGPEAAHCERLARRGETAHAAQALTAALKQSPGDLHLLRLALDLAWRTGRNNWAADLLTAPWPPALDFLRLALLGNLRFLLGDYAEAEAAYARANAIQPLPTFQWRQGECLARLGDTNRALELWRAALDARPWNANLLLRAHDAATGLDAALRPLDGPLVVLLYSWNKAELLDATLAALFNSDLGLARVLVLNNGSTDATGDVLCAWEGRAGKDRLTRIDLPVNVGAPAARNWLISRPEVAASRYAAFLDDDALPPSDWLGRLGAAAAACPGAGVYGCKVRDAATPAVIQNADLHLRPGLGAPAEKREGGCALALSDLHLLEPDYGQFDYLRPCVSVTGCCHLFRTQVLLEGGGFDLGLSPSQMDDLEHDLRLNLGGLPAVYQGHLSVGHARRSGVQTRQDPRAAANAYGNQAKIERRYTQRDMARIAGQDRARLADDLARKLAVLNAAG